MSQAEIIVRCYFCSGLNNHGLPFCLYCGTNLEGNSEKKQAVPRACKVCSIIDPLSQQYCIHCGAGMNVLDQVNYILSDTPVSNPALPRPRNTSSRKKRSNGLQEMAVAAIFLGTIIAAIFAFCQYQLAENTGVLVHASPVGSEVTIEDKSGCVLKTGFIDDKGDLKLNGLRPGTYEVSVSHVGFQTASQDVRVFANKTVAIGIPNTLELDVEAKPTANTAAQLDEPAVKVSEKKLQVESAVGDQSATIDSSNQQTQSAPQAVQAVAATAAMSAGQPNRAALVGGANSQAQPTIQSQTVAQSNNLAPVSFSPPPQGPAPFRWARFGRMMPRGRRVFNGF